MLAGSQVKSNQAAMTLKVGSDTAVLIQPTFSWALVAGLCMCSTLQDSLDHGMLRFTPRQLVDKAETGSK
jgi:hypothetical protein